MATSIYVLKRRLRTKRRNGQHNVKLALRWKDPIPGKWECESTGTADRTEAESLRKLKWAEVSGMIARQEPELALEPAAQLPTWDDCRDALERAMRADNLRPLTVADYCETFGVLQRTFSDCSSPADITEAMANDYELQRAELGISP